jgi:hypothetical protein
VIPAMLLLGQIAVTAQVPTTVGTCEPLEVALRVTSPSAPRGGVAPRIGIPRLGPFEVLRASGTPHVSMRGGLYVAEYRIVLAASAPGAFELPPFTASLDGLVARSESRGVQVREDHRLTPIIAGHLLVQPPHLSGSLVRGSGHPRYGGTFARPGSRDCVRHREQTR